LKYLTRLKTFRKGIILCLLDKIHSPGSMPVI